MDFIKPILPVLTLHGSSPESLRNDYMNVLKEIYSLQEAIRKVDFHSRDYNGQEEWTNARIQRLEIMAQLKYIQNHFEIIAESI